MYHIGKVIEVYRPTDKDVISADGAVQATMRMWDENVLTMLVSPKIAGKIKEGQVVMADYRPDPAVRAPVPLHTIVKIISGKKAESAWKAYREVYEKQKKAQQPGQAAQSYIA
jgi:hypothetical protein